MGEMEELRARVRQRVDEVWDDPAGRKALRVAFYKKYGGPQAADSGGYGHSELAFMDWEIQRGVLGERGSPWWKEVNGQFMYWSELAAVAKEANADGLAWDQATRSWLDYIESPSAERWYRAHNTSISLAYLSPKAIELCKRETLYEQGFVNLVLARVLYAQALVVGDTQFGEIGAELSDPDGDAVGLITLLPDFYPDQYPLTEAAYREIIGEGDDLGDALVRSLRHVIRSELPHLFSAAAEWNGIPALRCVLSPENHLLYPRLHVEGAKRRIAILGGGLGGLASAWTLTSRDGWERDYEIDLYQIGWRCGGKMKGGRGENDRVEELGLHLLLGFYELAWPMYAKAYEERAQRGLAPDASYQTLADAIKPNNSALLVSYDAKQGGWTNWPLIFPVAPGTPGDGHRLTTWQQFKKGIAIVLEMILGSPYAKHHNGVVEFLLHHVFPKDGGADAPPGPLPHPKRSLLEGVISTFRAVELTAATTLSRMGISDMLGQLLEASAEPVLKALIKVLQAIVQDFNREVLQASAPTSRTSHIAMFADFGIALAAGIVYDIWSPRTGKFNFEAVNDLDFREWLRRHGAAEETLAGPIVTFFYQATFEGLADGRGGGGLLAAGSACQFLLPAMGYKGSFINQLRLGTADTLIMPLYQVLAARGVRFHFFHSVTDIAYPGDGKPIQTIRLEKQVELATPAVAYDPVRVVKGNPSWPGAPLYEQLDPAQAAKLKEQRIDLESAWSTWDEGTAVTLEHGKDFDAVVLAIPSPAHPQVCPSLCDNVPSWKEMAEGTPSAQIMSAQLWFEDGLRELGFQLEDWGLGPVDCVPNVVTYANPLFSWLDQSQVIQHENWPGKPPGMLAMFTGVLPDELETSVLSDPTYPKTQYQRSVNLTWQWLMDNMGWFLKGATTLSYPAGLDLERLKSTGHSTDGRAKFGEQFFTVGINPSDRYVIALPKTGKVRKKPGDSGFPNLFLAGDWTDYGANIGFMEGVTQSAHQSVDALLASIGIAPPL